MDWECVMRVTNACFKPDFELERYLLVVCISEISPTARRFDGGADICAHNPITFDVTQRGMPTRI